MYTPHKQTRRLTQKLWKRAIYGWRRAEVMVCLAAFLLQEVI